MPERDPVCGMEVDLKRVAFSAEHKGKTYYFCTLLCQVLFQENPEEYLANRAPERPGSEGSGHV